MSNPAWAIDDVELRTILQRAHDGENPEAILAEMYAASVVEDAADRVMGEG